MVGPSIKPSLMRIAGPALTAIFCLTLLLPWSTAAEQQGETKGRPSTLRIESGTLVTSAGIPIGLQHVDVKIVGSKKPEQDGKDKQDGQDEKKSGDDKKDSKNETAKSEAITIETGTVVLKSNSLTRLLNQKVGKNGKLEDLKVTTDKSKNEVHITGKAKKVIGVPFELKGPVKATPNGQIQLDATSVKAADIPGLAQLLGLTVQKAAGTHAAKGVKTETNTIVFNPDQLWGLPVHGFVRQAHVEQDGLVLLFGQPGQNSPKKKLMARSSKSTAQKK